MNDDFEDLTRWYEYEVGMRVYFDGCIIVIETPIVIAKDKYILTIEATKIPES